MKWITVADELPVKKTDDLSKDKGIIFVNKKRTAIMYVFLSITPNIPSLLQNDLKGWEWLDESEEERTFSLKECPHCQISPVMCKCCGETL